MSECQNEQQTMGTNIRPDEAWGRSTLPMFHPDRIARLVGILGSLCLWDTACPSIEVWINNLSSLTGCRKNKRRIKHSADLHEHVWFPLSLPDPGESNGGKEAEKKMCDLTISILVFPLQFAQILSVLVCQKDVVFVLVAYQFFPAVTCWPTCGKNHTCSKCCEQKKGDCNIQNCNR